MHRLLLITYFPASCFKRQSEFAINRVFRFVNKLFDKENRVLWLAILIHLAIALPLAWTLNVWLDEAWTMRTTANGLAQAFRDAVWEERQAPVYFLILAVWRSANDSLFWARAFSVVCACASIFVFDKLTKRFLHENKRNVFVFFFAAHPFLIYAALEARVYALIVLLSTLLLLVWHDAYAAGENRRLQFVYVSLGVFALYTNYYLGFGLVAGAAALIVLRRWSALKNYLWQMAAVAVLILPLAYLIKTQFSANNQYFRAEPSFLGGAKLIWNLVNDFVLPTPAQTLFAAARLWIVRIGFLLVVLTGVYQFFYRPNAETQKATSKTDLFDRENLNFVSPRFGDLNFGGSKTFALAVFCAVAAAFLFAAYFLLGADYVQQRHAAPLFAPLFLLLAAVLAKNLSPRNLIAASGLLIVFYAAALVETYSPLAKRGDWRRVADFIRSGEQPDEPIAVFRVYDALPFKFYYSGQNQVVPPTSFHGWNAENAPESGERWRTQIEFLKTQIPAAQQRLWLITEDRCDAPETAIECRPLEEFVIENYETLETRNFYTRKVRLLKRRAN